MQTDYVAKDTSGIASKVYFGFAAVVILYALGLSFSTLRQSYSFWLDELFSVTASDQSLHSMFTLILSDVHPPLYQLVLKLWIALFGDSDIATRSLSWCAALIAILPVYRTCLPMGKSCAITAVLLLTTSTLFGFYGNETRAYAFLMMWSAFAYQRFSDVDETRRPSAFLLNCLILSLVHYFGLLFAWVLLLISAWTFRRNKASLAALALTFALTCVWPVFHVMLGTVSSKANGNFWIHINGALETLSTAAFSLFPIYGTLAGIVLVAWLLVILASTFASATLRASRDPLVLNARKTVLAILGFLALLCIVDHFTPMSTRRNYIVLLPPACVLAAHTIHLVRTWSPRLAAPMFALALACGIASTGYVASALNEKTHPVEDWQGAAQYIVDHDANMNVYFVTNSYANTWRMLTSTFYLNKLSGGRINAKPLVPGETRITAPALIFVAHFPFGEQFLNAMKAAGATQRFPAGPFNDVVASVFRVDAPASDGK
ncbi:hypothetical protein AWB79_01367 [Caballeronia hypogeia]|uniref:Glycosyltransferase RgtA/B/C/D-like domain-containing protein n=1 Tax=Caballeronia hypogeia TaxID=1777140 RepID=A0A157ZU84_9BURK|nr:glycosyltransferase family 39 protein [Caballeronia hypogeia]SAK49050.1 hypothetical protein AWB79_01367 [Caballeronia hypogeia]